MPPSLSSGYPNNRLNENRAPYAPPLREWRPSPGQRGRSRASRSVTCPGQRV
eukprot:CAMPEP_0173377850 /NCGR_PEP_ID=MMETSP1356-20130122/1137_1 /TAXON_ID=77927 ORGANISM="Hemiselmis virescens, Strain PCC157" /NCGR_SAMPLE_ID=MMETSP1356 /ASSEMBLY_ACC=CAM_ASM_000847 /LENGTH=51 /DNA_ID=CAMNT_0014330751 /DNA_START=36 /DNA_END=187 /DNA_ORIENTATION=-